MILRGIRQALGQMKVCLIDDNPDDALLIREMLQEAKGTSFTFHHSPLFFEGLDHLKEDPADVVLLDLGLPDSYGLDSITKLHQDFPDIPIIVLTSAQDETMGVNAVQAGAQDYLIKGKVDSRNLIRAIDYSIQRHSTRVELHRYVNDLKLSESRLRDLIEKNADGIVILSRTGIVRYANPAAELILDRSSAEMIGFAFGYSIIPGKTVEATVGRRYGGVSIVEMRVEETEWEGEKAFFASLRDISERRQAEAERFEAERKMQEGQRFESLGVLAGGIAHDFNNILTAILGNASLARLEVAPDSLANEYLEHIENASLRAADICRQMLDYSGKGRFEVQRLDLSSIVEDTKHLLQISISKKAQLKFNLPSGLAPVLADPTQLRQVIMNLVINASEAIGNQNGVIAVTTGTFQADQAYLDSTHLPQELEPGEYVFLEVRDNGCGMDEETKSRILDPFYTTKFTGRGLGLAVVFGIVRGHRGALKIESELELGTTVRFLLPIAEGHSEQVASRTATSSNWRGSGTVLVVDDEEPVRHVATRMLESFGFKVIQAVDGVDAVVKVKEFPGLIRLVLLDMMMPQMDGAETLEQIRRLDPKIQIILTSGFSERELHRRFGENGPDGFVPKPFRAELLKEKIHSALSKVE